MLRLIALQRAACIKHNSPAQPIWKGAFPHCGIMPDPLITHDELQVTLQCISAAA